MATFENIPGEVKPDDPIFFDDENVMRVAMRQLYGSSMQGGMVGSTGMHIKPQRNIAQPVMGRIQAAFSGDKQRHGWDRVVYERIAVNIASLGTAKDENVIGGFNDKEAFYAVEMYGKKDIPPDIFEALMMPVFTDQGPIFFFALETYFDCLAARDDAGGDAALGDKDNPCTATYTVKTIHLVDGDRKTFGTAITPLKRRPAKGKLDLESSTDDGTDFHPAQGKLTNDGFRLWDANETLDVQSCTTT